MPSGRAMRIKLIIIHLILFNLLPGFWFLHILEKGRWLLFMSLMLSTNLIGFALTYGVLKSNQDLLDDVRWAKNYIEIVETVALLLFGCVVLAALSLYLYSLLIVLSILFIFSALFYLYELIIRSYHGKL